MRHGMLWTFLLILPWLFQTAFAQEITPSTRQLWLESDNVQQNTADIVRFARIGDVDAMAQALSQLPTNEQEAVRFLLLEHIETEEMLLTAEVAEYVQSLSLIAPAFYLRHFGDGYEFVTPAFSYPSIANRIVKKWQYDQKVTQFILAVERQELSLEKWLNEGSLTENKLREQLLIAEMDGLSPPAILFLVEQVLQTDNKIIFWLPSNAVMVKLAQLSNQPKLYSMLWKMKTDKSSKQELFRLMEVADEFSIKMIIGSASNPSLNEEVIKYFAAKRPKVEVIEDFLVASLSVKENDKAYFTASELSKQGYDKWLKELLISTPSVNSRAIKKVLSE